MNRQIVLSPLTLALSMGLVLAALVIAVLVTLMFTGGDEHTSSGPAGHQLPAPMAPVTLTVDTSSTSAGVTAAGTESRPTVTPDPPTPLPPTPEPPSPTLTVVVAQATPAQLTATPTTVPPACVARVVAASYPSGMVGTVTVINELSGKSAAFLDRGFSMWVAGSCAAHQGTCPARVIGYVYYPGGAADRTTTVVSELTGEVSSYVATGASNYLPGACVGG